MCLVLMAFDIHPVFKLVMAANRDEFYDRPTAPLAIWADKPGVIAGRDLKGGGTWMGVSPAGRLAAITNYRDPHTLKADAPTRGALVTDFLTSRLPARTYLENLTRSAKAYNGFNLVVYDGKDFCFFSNHEGLVRSISPGFHGLSNHHLDTPWPKIKRGLTLFKGAVQEDPLSPEIFFEMLGDRNQPPDETLPDTGVGLEWERILSPLFITSDIYGTRSSSLLTIDRAGRIEYYERSHNAENDSAPAHQTRRVSFQVPPAV